MTTRKDLSETGHQVKNVQGRGSREETVGLIDGMEILVVGFTKSDKIQETQ